MKNEYLFLNSQHKASVREYRQNDNSFNISNISGSHLWIASSALDGNTENNAATLSELHTFIMGFQPLVLKCDSAEYYDRKLYPSVNNLERKLRKLLYLRVSVSDNQQAKDTVNELEHKDFGTIFDLLFIDPSFILDVKKRTNADSKSEFNGRDKFTKTEIEAYLASLEERTLWDALFEPNEVPTLRKRFREVQQYRNAVMHAHNINHEDYKVARSLFRSVVRELDDAINQLSEELIEKSKAVANVTRSTQANTALASALAAMDISSLMPKFSIAAMLPKLDITALFPSPQSSEAMKSIQSLNSLAVTEAALEKIQFQQSQLIREALKALRPTPIPTLPPQLIKQLRDSIIRMDSLDSADFTDAPNKNEEDDEIPDVSEDEI